MKLVHVGMKLYNKLLSIYPDDKEHKKIFKAYFRNLAGKTEKDTLTNEGRRIDFIVSKNKKVIRSNEVTSKTAPKE